MINQEVLITDPSDLARGDINDLDQIEVEYIVHDAQNRKRPRRLKKMYDPPDELHNYEESGPHHLEAAVWGWQSVKPDHGPRRDWSRRP